MPRAYAAIGDQSFDPAANNGTDQSDDDSSTKPQAPPSPTPGSKANEAPAATATANDSALDPNAALFDAISRGDLAAARDAVARGADLNATNALGQKPVDASVDLGRNDITIMLLAQRPLVVDTSTGAEVLATAAVTPVAVTHAGSSRRAAAPQRELAEAKPVANPGTPQPQVGFLGF